MSDLEKIKKCIKDTVNNWDKTTLTDIEKWSVEKQLVSGIARCALYILPEKEYQKLRLWTIDNYGFW